MLERHGSHAVIDPGPRHDLSHLSSERFRRASRAAGCSNAVSRSSAGLDHQDRIHNCSSERRLLCSTWQRWYTPRRRIAEATDNGKTVLGVPGSDFVCAGAPQGSLGHRSGPVSEQSAVAARDRLARQVTVGTLSFVPTLDVRLRQSRIGCRTRAASITRHDSQELAGWSLVSNHERLFSASRLINTTR